MTSIKYKPKLHGSFAIKNNLIDKGVMAALSGAELKCYVFIYRKTIGWQKKADIISNGQFLQYTGLSRQSVVTATKNLEQLGLISCMKCKRNMTRYQLDNRYLSSLTDAVEQKNKKLSPKGVRNLLLHRKKIALTEQIIYPTKDILLKDNYTKEELLNLFYEKTPPFESMLLKQAGIELTEIVLIWLLTKTELLTKDYVDDLRQEAVNANQTIESVINQKMISQHHRENQPQNDTNTETDSL